MIVDELRKINSSVPVVKTNDFGHMHANRLCKGYGKLLNADEKKFCASSLNKMKKENILMS